MKIYKISQSVNNGYDTFDSAIVIAESPEQAKRTHPYRRMFNDVYYDEEKRSFWSVYSNGSGHYQFENEYGTWTNDLSKIAVEEVGDAGEGRTPGVIVASFNAG